jgi:hypothetical protein
MFTLKDIYLIPSRGLSPHRGGGAQYPVTQRAVLGSAGYSLVGEEGKRKITHNGKVSPGKRLIWERKTLI